MSNSQNSLFDTGDSLAPTVVPLAELTNGQEADFFALLSAKEELTTKDGKPYFRVTFRDAAREVSFPIWNDTTWTTVCRDTWSVGDFFKLRALYRETTYGPQLEIRKIRLVNEEDKAEGFDPAMCLPAARYDPQQMFNDLVELVRQQVADQPLADFAQAMLEQNREVLLTLPAAKYNHHAHASGFLEHVLSVSRTAAFLAEKYAALYPDLQPPLNQGLIVAGAVLHDIGKVRELETTPTGAEYTVSGTLIGHILQGRDMVRELAVDYPLDEETLLRLEHIIISHQRLPEWGSPKPPMFPEALIIHYADDLDAKLEMMVSALATDTTGGPLTSSRNPLRQQVYRGSESDAADSA